MYIGLSDDALQEPARSACGSKQEREETLKEHVLRGDPQA